MLYIKKNANFEQMQILLYITKTANFELNSSLKLNSNTVLMQHINPLPRKMMLDSIYLITSLGLKDSLKC